MHCAELAHDGMVYVCDRVNDRLQVFTKDGKFVKEIFVEKNTKGDGAVWDIAFSKDREQKYFYHGRRREREDSRLRSRCR